nr:GDSL-type esterase/lipase family protein [uncultured Pedobacter sp.]
MLNKTFSRSFALLFAGIILFASTIFAKNKFIENLKIESIDTSYLASIKAELLKKWPKNRSINLVFHGHSVPSGYQRTPIVNTFGSYPLLVLKLIIERYPYAVVNVIKTTIGGENAEQGAKRFKKEVLIHKPDVLFIDYALNDRKIGLARAKKAWEKMINMTLKKNIKLVLLTPTPDLKENIKDDNALLAQHTAQILGLGVKYHVPVINSYQAFKDLALSGVDLKSYMAQNNHINSKGHKIVAELIDKLF